MEDLLAGCILILLATLFFGVIGGFGLAASSYECKSKYGDFENRFKIVGGCQVKMDGKWIPSDSYYFKED